jgi:hypothetical protein
MFSAEMWFGTRGSRGLVPLRTLTNEHGANTKEKTDSTGMALRVERTLSRRVSNTLRSEVA